ncbi:hypothetical protein [Helicobacter sp. MIT 05-5294]|uniref:hypothetical protein n=1 Tax=Helicobacter sp. MIT 05-5294 TaxID=1548150 RepID=UPI00051F91E8|nr:hypothetical protein [Helicobacter sp. MIT 05-5294]TLD85490.1 hypothetical protein LS69_009325 [Helicobacter sp. MIT 05-5294]
MKFKKVSILCYVLLVVSSFAFAQDSRKEENNLSKACIQYAEKIKNKDILDVYSMFDKKGQEAKLGGFTYQNLNVDKLNAYIRLYEFQGVDLNGAYNNLLQIILNNKNLSLRKSLPQQNEEDTLYFMVSLKGENNGKTCYIRQNSNELWIESEPLKDKKFVFILKQENKNTKLYYYETISFDED